MAVEWTEEQQQVIDTRDSDILVSAAAGSGKTAVLVERIIKKITDSQHPVDIDRLLVVTFTKAAAAEMRERISTAIEKKREEMPDDRNLIRQASLIHNAQITTIDSFCLFVVRNHFGEIHLDPNFRIADQGEICLLEMDVLKEVFEEEYERAREEEKTAQTPSAFLALIDAYSGKRSDRAVKDMVSKIYRASASNPWPEEWVKSLSKVYEAETVEELLESSLVQQILSHVTKMLADLGEQTKQLIAIAEAADGPQKYAQTLYQDLELIEMAQQKTDFREMQEYFSAIRFSTLSAIRNFDGDVQKKEAVQNGRKLWKQSVEEIRDTCFLWTPESLFEQLGRIRPMVCELVRLTLRYMEAMAEKKRKKRIVDFSDMEHFALDILVDHETKKSSATAAEFRAHFDEIMIDEYQDSNQVQETIMRAISKEQDGKYNMFMVGDVKQSIYRFRLARPELFMEKYKAFDGSNENRKRIDLFFNFRSRREVVTFTNDMFYKMMHHDLGGVDYDDEAALYCGANYPEAEHMEAEVLLFDQKDLEEAESGVKKALSELDAHRLEAKMIASRIHELMKNQMVTDKETRQLRPVKYSDIVILLRGLKNWGSDFTEVLESCGIPAHVESSTGYFSAVEVQTVLNMLRILDNPYQDIPMAAVLKSPMAGLDDEELAEIRITNREIGFAECAYQCMQEAKEGTLFEFYRIYRSLRSCRDLPIHELIEQILEKTGYGCYVAALPAGKKRAANLDMLIEKAIAYEKTSYKGLFHFVRYMDQLEEYEIDFGEANVTGENEDVVHIMTIHKSKGLEFPVVFVSGLAKKFNQMDAREKMVIHPDLGIGLCEMSTQPRIRRQCLWKNEIANRIMRENSGEELRILYVALTRAKEKLILTGLISDKEKTLAKYTANVMEKKPLSYVSRLKAGSYLDWILPAILSYPDRYSLTFMEPQKLIVEEVRHQAFAKLDYEKMKKQIANANQKWKNHIIGELMYQYPYQQDAAKKSKYSVSELKHASMAQQYDHMEQDAEIPAFLLEEHESYVPDFAQNESTISVETSQTFGVSRGALRGTAVHRFMECLDFAKMVSINQKDVEQVKKFVRDEFGRMKQSGELTEDMAELIQPSVVEQFAASEVAMRMARAAVRGQLFKEKPFVMEYEGVLVQGIIDVFWIEEDGLVVLDYKTDRVSHPQELIARYQTQLHLYADALSRIFSNEEQQMKAKESLIYSFRLQEVIRL